MYAIHVPMDKVPIDILLKMAFTGDDPGEIYWSKEGPGWAAGPGQPSHKRPIATFETRKEAEEFMKGVQETIEPDFNVLAMEVVEFNQEEE